MAIWEQNLKYLYNIWRIRPFLSEHSTQLFVQALVLSRLDYCNALLALPASSIKPLQLIQNAATRLIFNEPKRTHVIPLFINLHWLPIAARMKFKALMFAYKTTSGSAPLYLNSVLQTYVPLEACILQMNVALLFIPKRHKIIFTDFYIKYSLLVEWPAKLNPSSWILRHLQESAKNTSSIFIWPSNCSTLYSNSISICFLFYLYQNNSWPSNTCTLYSISILTTWFIFVYYKIWPSNKSILYYFDLFYFYLKKTL